MVHPQLIPTKGPPVGSGGLPAERALGVSGSASGVGHGTHGVHGSGSIASVTTVPAALKAERHEPKIFGFRVNEEAKLSRWRTAKRDESVG